jgi:hypothetical protein
MAELSQVKAQIPRELKRRFFVVLAEQERKFAPWLREQMENLLRDPGYQGERSVSNERA